MHQSEEQFSQRHHYPRFPSYMADLTVLKSKVSLALRAFPAWDLHSPSHPRSESEYEDPQKVLALVQTLGKDTQPEVVYAHEMFLDDDNDSSSDDPLDYSPELSRPASIAIDVSVQPIASLQLLPASIAREEVHPIEPEEAPEASHPRNEAIEATPVDTEQEVVHHRTETPEQVSLPSPTEGEAGKSPVSERKEDRKVGFSDVTEDSVLSPSQEIPAEQTINTEETSFSSHEASIVTEEPVGSSPSDSEPVVVLKFKPRPKTRCLMSEIEEAESHRETDSFLTTTQSVARQPEEVIVPVMPVVERTAEPPKSFEQGKKSTDDRVSSKKCCSCSLL